MHPVLMVSQQIKIVGGSNTVDASATVDENELCVITNIEQYA